MSDNSPIIKNDEINLAELWRTIWSGKILIAAITLLFAIGSIFYALSKPNIYQASVLLAPASSQNGSGGLAALAGQFGGLASMAGINLGATGADKTSLALATLQSRSFIENFINKHHLLVPLMAAENWNKATNELVLNELLYNKKNNTWLLKSDLSQPSPWEAYLRFSQAINISQDKTSSLITIDLDYYSPLLAKEWLTILVSEINEFIRNQEKEETQASIDYLKNQLKKIQVSNMETVFYQLIEEQTKTMMLAQVKQEYAFRTIDPAQVPDIKSSPNRALMVIIGTMLGAILSILLVLIRSFFNKNHQMKL
jgi:LPS O-antigen subunit length determinant protein (WzzB/FepE family)